MTANDAYDDQHELLGQVGDAAYDAMRELARTANTSRAISPPTLYQALGNLSSITGMLHEILPSLARAARTGGTELELDDSEGGNPAQHLAATTQALDEAAVEVGRLLTQLQAAHAQLASVGFRD